MRWRGVLTLLVGAAVATVACPSDAPIGQQCKYPAEGQYRQGPRITGATFEGVVVTWGAWEPGADEIARAEERLPGFIASQAGGEPLRGTRIPFELSRYYRRYCGVQANPQQLMILFAHQSSSVAADWLRGEPLAVFDGYDTFFEVIYEVKTGRFRSLNVNTAF